ncbi:MAG: TatD family hydrolase [Candidatus Zixiibacteriota bacterium]|nr:MAG: TatD family hydrolase [candidate division Zixibacteria bacterium]
MMIDSHCHLNFIEDCGSTEELINEAVDAGVSTIVNIGADLESSLESVRLAEEFPQVYATVGVHPHDASTAGGRVIERLRQLTSRPRVVAIGEIGLDFYRDLSPRQTQRSVFEKLLRLAADCRLPVVIHAREALQETVEIVRDYASGLPGGVFHCFPGTVDDAEGVFELGFVISVGGVITYKGAGMAEVARLVPLDKVIVETDAPYLTPVPFRGKTNRPALVRQVYSKLAELRGMDASEVEKTVDRTCQKLFALVDVFGD